jgi:hypothetical protein
MFTVDQCLLRQRSALTKVYFDKGLPHQFITKDFLLINLNITTIYKVYILEKVTLEGLGLLDQFGLESNKRSWSPNAPSLLDCQNVKLSLLGCQMWKYPYRIPCKRKYNVKAS